jgi:hypothetical protein
MSRHPGVHRDLRLGGDRSGGHRLRSGAQDADYVEQAIGVA